MDRIMDSREGGDDLLQWLFQLIVDHVEVADENKQFIRPLEVVESTPGGRFRIVYTNPSAIATRIPRHIVCRGDSSSPVELGDWSKPSNQSAVFEVAVS
jgi:hypothetical protein